MQAPPEHPFPEYPRPNPFWRLLALVRDHGFTLAVLGTLLVVGGVIQQFQRWEGEDAGVPLIPLSSNAAALASIPARDSMALLTVDSYPGEAEILLDGASLGLTPQRGLDLPAGTYRVSVQKPSYQPVDSTITLSPGQTAMLLIPLRAARPSSETGRPITPGAVADAAAPPRSAADGTARRPSNGTAAPAPAPRVNPALGHLELRSEPAGAAVWMDGQLVGRTPLSLGNVAPGRRSLSFRLDGYDAPTTTVEVRPGYTATVNPRLTPLVGTLKVLARPWGTIYIDGELKREASDVRYATSLPEGRYRVTVVHPVLGQWETVADVKAGKEASYVVDFNRINASGPTAERSPVRGW